MHFKYQWYFFFFFVSLIPQSLYSVKYSYWITGYLNPALKNCRISGIWLSGFGSISRISRNPVRLFDLFRPTRAFVLAVSGRAVTPATLSTKGLLPSLKTSYTNPRKVFVVRSPRSNKKWGTACYMRLVFSRGQGLPYHITCKPDFLRSWPSLNSYLK